MNGGMRHRVVVGHSADVPSRNNRKREEKKATTARGGEEEIAAVASPLRYSGREKYLGIR